MTFEQKWEELELHIQREIDECERIVARGDDDCFSYGALSTYIRLRKEMEKINEW